MLVLRQKWFGKILESNPGLRLMKNSAKYAFDKKEDYEKNKGEYALKGLQSPITSIVINQRVKEMHKRGASAAEIKKYLDDSKHRKHQVGEIGSQISSKLLHISQPPKIATRLVSGTPLAVTAKGAAIHDVRKGNRKEFK